MYMINVYILAHKNAKQHQTFLMGKLLIKNLLKFQL